ncbi:MAG: hypothetical protein IKH07_09695 [Oscillospiraceae bacterium]|nr:hypothetical protein [Oscillospiraceae bacterium]
MEKLITKIEDGAAERYLAYDQEWTEAALAELRREHGVFFRADSAVAVRVRGSILALGIEDDGCISFGPEAPRFHAAYAPALASELVEAAAAAAKPQSPASGKE